MSASSRSRRRRTIYIEGLEPRVLLSTYTVTSLADDGSAGTLRWAVQQANANPGPDTINFAAGLSGKITLTSGQLEISNTTGQTTIAGPGSGLGVSSQSSRDFTVDAGAAVSISGLALTGVDSGPIGGGVLLNSGTVMFSACSLSGRASNDGGVIYNNGGKLTLTECYFTQATFPSGQGGAIYNARGAVYVEYTEFDTFVAYSGGAITNYGNLSFANNTVHDTFGSAGAIENFGIMTVANSTFWNNGVAIHSSGTLTIGDSTVFQSGGVSVDNGSGDTTIYNSIIDSISSGLDQHLAPGQTPSSHNLIVGSQSGGLLNGVNGNLVNVDPMLTRLTTYGGPTATFVPLPGSPAIDAGSNALAVDLTSDPPIPLRTDQTGYPRIYNGTVDIGAVEVQPKLVNTTVAGAGGPGQFTFDDAFQLYARALPGGTVRFDPTVFAPGVLHTVQMGGLGDDKVDQPVTVAVQGLGADTIALNVPPTLFGAATTATLSLSGVAITGRSSGSAMLNYGTLELTNCAVYGNTGGSFPAILNEQGGTLKLTDTSFFDNSALQGGKGSALDNQGTASIMGCTFANNAADAAGAIYNEIGGSVLLQSELENGTVGVKQ